MSWPKEANQKRWGDPVQRFWNQVELSESCWLWRGLQNGRGYGRVFWQGRQRLAHGVAWLLEHGYEPEAGFEIDHICNNRLCVNPQHLQLLSHRENVLRGTNFTAINVTKTHCKFGHPLVVKGSRRRCVECDRRVGRESARRRREAARCQS